MLTWKRAGGCGGTMIWIRLLLRLKTLLLDSNEVAASGSAAVSILRH